VKKILVIASHPDDETLGCGGTLLKHIAAGDQVHWLIVTSISTAIGFAAERVVQRDAEIKRVAASYGFAAVHQSGFPTMRLDRVGKLQLIESVSSVVRKIEPDTLYIPYRNDAHSDHAAVFDAAVACNKSFRYPSVRSVYTYETLSETNFGLRTDDPGFRPNRLVDITNWLEQKISIMHMFGGEMAAFPFPRSETCMRAQAALRGSQANVMAAEAFMVLKEIR
jgi:LmbE family N-acetylglucosaminyl deacetylase